ncbi:hypothetical protein JAAARDRAFT_198474 [Jaapia argillacea MUCL 33604]|uniref:Protein kinase domain-containing protein n=1 Tax=Jaapia argillacea MUCL 33604 TaxID=933084 RepID=A0A067PM64_9AGAM|nr:hypothetical protein JAAARDRAFT_198474 [Jaapia argillacea MUCL 33604]
MSSMEIFEEPIFLSITEGAYTTSSRPGSPRWMAAELLFPERFDMVGTRRTCATDIYAYGCVCIELHTGLAPFYDLNADSGILVRILSGVNPQPPPGKELPPKMWNIAEKCWRMAPETRPKAKNIVKECHRSFNLAQVSNRAD